MVCLFRNLKHQFNTLIGITTSTNLEHLTVWLRTDQKALRLQYIVIPDSQTVTCSPTQKFYDICFKLLAAISYRNKILLLLLITIQAGWLREEQEWVKFLVIEEWTRSHIRRWQSPSSRRRNSGGYQRFIQWRNNLPVCILLARRLLTCKGIIVIYFNKWDWI